MKDGKITLKRAVNCYTPLRLKEGNKEYERSLLFFKENGFHFEDCWNLDAELAYLILIRLVNFKENQFGYPSSYEKEGESSYMTNKRWRTQLDKMIRAFYLYCVLDFPNEKENKIIKKGMRIFIENFPCLWD